MELGKAGIGGWSAWGPGQHWFRASLWVRPAAAEILRVRESFNFLVWHGPTPKTVCKIHYRLRKPTPSQDALNGTGVITTKSSPVGTGLSGVKCGVIRTFGSHQEILRTA